MWAKSQLLLASTLLLAIVGVGYTQKQGYRPRFGQRISQSQQRSGKTLLNTFPFNRRNQNHAHDDHAHGAHHAHHDDHHHAHDHHHQGDDLSSSRSSRQDLNANNEVALDIGSIAAAGEKCVDKVVMVSETEYDDQITCKHSYSTHCHVTYKTDYEPTQEEECEENFKKRCFIEFKNVASQEKVEFCFTPLVKNCDIPGPEVCSTEYRSECTTRYHEHEVEEDRPVCKEEQEEKCQQVTQGYSTSEECTKWPVMKCTLETKTVKKYTPETDCKKNPFELCGPSACPVEPGEEQCFDKTETVVQEVPEEQCTLEPQKECKQVTKLVPLLKPAEECVDIPKEVCVRQRTNPRRVQKPVIKKWCYTPSPESGLPGPVPRPPPPPRPTRPPIRDPEVPDSNSEKQGYPQVAPVPTSCAPGYDANHCPAVHKNGVCNPECNTPACGLDGGDCRAPPPPPPPREEPSCARGYPASHCPSRASNGVCDPECNTNACGQDGGDCRQAAPPSGYLPPPSSYLPPPGNGGY
jgi:hypothetical protein